MNHTHHHAPLDYNRAFTIGIALNLVFVAIEAGFGLYADSLALVADAGHNFSDVLGLLLAWGASLLAGRRPTARRTYGFRRATILSSLFSSVLLLVAIGAIAWEAIGRFREPAPVNGFVILVVAAIGVLINTFTALLFSSGRKSDLNIKGAFMHMAADALVSAGVVFTGLIVTLTQWNWIDPAMSLVIAGIILIGTWSLLRDSLNLAVDAVPTNIEPDRVREFLAGLPEVVGLHDLHIWGMSTTEAALTVHLIVPEETNQDYFLKSVSSQLHDYFGIEHSTIQIERGELEEPCEQQCG